jgi:hypothetical protein
VQAVKRQVNATSADHALTREAFEQELGDAVRTSPHFAEGIAAFREAAGELVPVGYLSARSLDARGIIPSSALLILSRVPVLALRVGRRH